MMNYLITLLTFLAVTILSPIDDIATVNKYKTQAEEAYQAGNYEEAARLYGYLVDSLQVEEPEVLLNLAHSHFKTENLEEAQSIYGNLSTNPDDYIRSVANQQLGVMSAQNQKKEEALTFFKDALKADPANEEARFNYELLKRQIEEEKKKEQEQQNQQDQDKQDQEQQEQQENQQQNQKQNEQENQEQQNQDSQEQDADEQEKKEQEQQKQQQQEQQPSEEEKKKQQQEVQQQRLEEIKMSKEKAEMILNALKNQEVQYYQQMKKKSKKKQDDKKPDW